MAAKIKLQADHAMFWTSVLERESVSRHTCANLGARGWEPDSPVAFLAPLHRLSTLQPGGSLAPQRPAAPSSSPVVAGGKHLGGGLVLALPGLRALEKAAVPPCLPHQPVPAALGRWGPGSVPFTRHLHLESVTWKIYGGVTNNSPGARGLGLFGERRKGNGT